MALEYRFLVDTLRDYSFAGYANDVTIYTKSATFKSGALSAYDAIAASSYMEIKLSNANGDFNLQDSTSKYYGKLRRGTLVKAQASLNGSNWTTLSVLKISDIIPVYSMKGDHDVILKCSDVLKGFLNQDFVAPLQTNVRIDEILDAIHATAKAIYPYESYYQFFGHSSIGDGRSPFDGGVWADFETAETTLPFYGDNLDRGQGVKAGQYIKDAVQAEIFGLYWFSPRSERFRFLSRYHASDTAISWYLNTTITDVPVYSYARDLVNDFALGYFPRAIGAANSVLWASDNVPFQLNAQETRRIAVKYRDPNQASASVGALVVDDLIRGVDFIANSEADGSGTDWTHFLTVTLLKGTATSEIVFYNRKIGDPAYITTLQVKGTPITAYNKEIAYGYNDDSIVGEGDNPDLGNDRASSSETLFAISDIDFAQAYADFKVNAFGDPLYVIEHLTIPVKSDDIVTQTQVLTRSIGDVINFTDPANAHDLDYMIVGESHSITPQTTPPTHTVVYTLRPTNRGGLFILDESTYGGGDIFSF